MSDNPSVPSVPESPASISESSPPVSESPTSQEIIDRHLQVRFKSDGERLLLILPPQAEEEEIVGGLTWTELWQQLKQRLNAGDRFWQPDTIVHLMAANRLLDSRQLQSIAEALSDAQLKLQRVFTSRRQTAVAAATVGYSVDQQSHQETLHQSHQPQGQLLTEPLYLETTVRSGTEIRHPGTVVIVGDLNPGSSVVAAGDILIWGRLRGVAHAGSGGNSQCMIMALQMEPTQIRIADAVARAPANSPDRYYPEVAYVTTGGIRLTRAADFSRSQWLAHRDRQSQLNSKTQDP
ncbi:MAG: septum site-determining protein MinC [Geitlerinemataceae cyanobacterium]